MVTGNAPVDGEAALPSPFPALPSRITLLPRSQFSITALLIVDWNSPSPTFTSVAASSTPLRWLSLIAFSVYVPSNVQLEMVTSASLI